MRYIILITLIQLSCVVNIQAEEITSIKSPDGFFIVGSNMVKQIKVLGSPDYRGYYKYESYVVTTSSKYSKHFNNGEITSRGWWVPDTQQFYSQGFNKPVKSPQCASWGKSNWSFSYTLIKTELNGKEASVWKEKSTYPNERKPKSSCVSAGINKYTCERVNCNRWDEPKPDGYIVKLKSEALNLFSKLN